MGQIVPHISQFAKKAWWASIEWCQDVWCQWKEAPARLVYIFLFLDWRPWEAASGVIMFFWGLINAIWPSPTFANTFDGVSWAAGLAIAFVGLVIQLGSLGSGKRSFRAVAGIISAVVWASLSFMFISNNLYTSATIIYPGFTTLTAWARFRVLVDRLGTKLVAKVKDEDLAQK